MNYAVIDLGFGDSGKGVTVNSLCKQFPDSLVIRFSGGQQAGHTVTLPDGTSHVFSNFGAGTFQGCPTYWSKFCTFDPVAVMRELKILQSKGYSPILYVDRKCPVTTPFEKFKNQTCQQTLSHGTCGHGVGATYAREESFYSLLAGDLEYPFVFQEKLGAIEKSHNPAFLDLRGFINACKDVFQSNCVFLCDGLPNANNYIYEGSQGLLLDQNIGFFPHVTRSNTGTKNILELSTWAPTLMLVTRAFQTRHGNGPMSNEHIPHNILDNDKETNIMNKYQGEFKKSLLDLSLLKYAMNKDDGIRTSYRKQLVVTCLDLVKNEYRYTIDGEIVGHANEDSFIDGIKKYLDIKVVHRVHSASDVVKATYQ